MKIKRIELTSIIQFLGEAVINVIGNINNAYIDNLADVSRINDKSLDWINPTKDNKQLMAEKSKACVLLVDDTITPIEGKVLIVVKNPKVCLAQIGSHFFVEKQKADIHTTAVVDKDAIIGENVYIGPYCVIGKATIGDGCIIDTYVRIHDCVTMGSHCHVKAGAVLGGEGFGFEKDDDGNRFRFPQIGDLIIGDNVEIGSNTCIDRGALSDTIIGSHTKINNLCHIAHNNIIGENVEITGCVNLSGGNVIEDNVWISPNSSLRGYIHVGKNSIIGTGAVVTKNIPAGEIWVGNPARKMLKK